MRLLFIKQYINSNHVLPKRMKKKKKNAKRRRGRRTWIQNIHYMCVCFSKKKFVLSYHIISSYLTSYDGKHMVPKGNKFNIDFWHQSHERSRRRHNTKQVHFCRLAWMHGVHSCSSSTTTSQTNYRNQAWTRFFVNLLHRNHTLSHRNYISNCPIRYVHCTNRIFFKVSIYYHVLSTRKSKQ